MSLSELMYSIVTALDSVEVDSDVEIGGVDQFLNMQMGRKVMEICGQEPQLVAATGLIEGTDGSGAKMSKSRNNYIAMTAAPSDMFGQLMSVPDRLVEPYLRALSEWTDGEIELVNERVLSREGCDCSRKASTIRRSPSCLRPTSTCRSPIW